MTFLMQTASAQQRLLIYSLKTSNWPARIQFSLIMKKITYNRTNISLHILVNLLNFSNGEVFLLVQGGMLKHNILMMKRKDHER